MATAATMIQTEVKVSGPIFDGRAQATVDAFITDAKERVADAGVNQLRDELGRVLRNPTGYYESRVQTDRAQQDPMVTDGGVVYGPWLAGVSSRNQTSRFKGYAHWRQATAQLQGRANDVAEQVLPPHLAAMNQ